MVQDGISYAQAVKINKNTEIPRPNPEAKNTFINVKVVPSPPQNTTTLVQKNKQQKSVEPLPDKTENKQNGNKIDELEKKIDNIVDKISTVINRVVPLIEAAVRWFAGLSGSSDLTSTILDLVKIFLAPRQPEAAVPLTSSS